ncbi:hypothetical protein AK812_SmicGene5596 [Symbiodinium microadriaticum]|uniref:Uncharacterized protein n=1 Tax=Symbiodinium microadriaticum TaxID=2951 RepID=A0A1Q9ETE0_SYMMI|nr:hypothetical protein AK812_SmicGene5596 [Symbiodinium microadriaticum]
MPDAMPNDANDDEFTPHFCAVGPQRLEEKLVSLGSLPGQYTDVVQTAAHFISGLAKSTWSPEVAIVVVVMVLVLVLVLVAGAGAGAGARGGGSGGNDGSGRGRVVEVVAVVVVVVAVVAMVAVVVVLVFVVLVVVEGKLVETKTANKRFQSFMKAVSPDATPEATAVVAVVVVVVVEEEEEEEEESELQQPLMVTGAVKLAAACAEVTFPPPGYVPIEMLAEVRTDQAKRKADREAAICLQALSTIFTPDVCIRAGDEFEELGLTGPLAIKVANTFDLGGQEPDKAAVKKAFAGIVLPLSSLFGE